MMGIENQKYKKNEKWTKTILENECITRNIKEQVKANKNDFIKRKCKDNNGFQDYDNCKSRNIVMIGFVIEANGPISEKIKKAIRLSFQNDFIAQNMKR